MDIQLLTNYSHQLTALAMMTEKERGIVDRPVFPSLWELSCASESTKRSFKPMKEV